MLRLSEAMFNQQLPMGYSQQSILDLQLSGLPPAWTHCLENSDTVLQRHKGSACLFVPLPQWQRSAIQAEVKEAMSNRLWQVLKAGPVRICSHRGFYRTDRYKNFIL